MIFGDINARTSNLQDFISVIDKSNIHDNVTIQTNTPQRSYDSEIDRNGQQIIQLCKENNIRIVNGRCLGDSSGKCTFFSPQRYKSLVDYTLVSDSFFRNISSLFVEPLTYFNDHCQVTTNIKMMHYTNKSPMGNSDYQWNYLPKSFKWKNTSSAKDFRTALKTPHIKIKIDYLMSNRFPESKEGIKSANRLLTNILCEAAKFSLPNSRVKRFKTRKPKKFCSKARVLYKQAANKANKYPSEAQLTEYKVTKLKELKKICKSQPSEFWDTRARELSETSNGKFWHIWKKCDESMTTKSPIACDGEKLESFYSKLFKDYDGNQFVNTLTTSVNQKKISKEHNQFISKLTSGAKLKKIVRSLKHNGKSPGIDRVSNEIIKHSFTILEKCFVKLFSLILIAGCVPNIWCKWLITPVHKKGDSSNPDNF